MSDFTRELRRQFEAKPVWGDINPLVVMGLTEAILDLEVSEDQLHKIVRSFARQLSAQVHPDKAPNQEVTERQKSIIAAFDFIDDEETFRVALKDFRNLKAEDRKENQALRQTIAALRRQLTSHAEEMNRFADIRRQITEERSAFERTKLEDPAMVPILEEKIERFNQVISAQERRIGHSEEIQKQWRRRHADSLRYIINLGEREENQPGAIFVYDTKWAAIASLPDIDSPWVGKRQEMEDVAQAAKSIGIADKEITQIKEAWQRYYNDNQLARKSQNHRLSLIQLNTGKPSLVIGQKTAVWGGNLIGSLDPKALPTMGRGWLEFSLQYEKVINTLTPYLAPGNLLVSVFKKRGDSHLDITCPAFKFTTKKIIIAVG